jgi:glycosyltransferase involved in cell wall biosynthesis
MDKQRHGVDLVHITTTHSALDTRIFYREAMSAHKAKIETIVIGPTTTSANERFRGIEIHALQYRHGRLLRRVLHPLDAFRKIIDLRPRIVHFHDPDFLPVAVLLKLLGYKMVWDVHEYYSEVKTANFRPGPLRSLLRILISALVEKGPCSFFDRSVFPTKSLRAAIRDKADALACVNLLPVEEFPDVECQPDKEFDLVFMGSMSPFRAGPLLQIFELLCAKRPGFKAALIGVPAATQAWMQKHAPSPLVLKAIQFVPRVPHLEVARLLRRARIGFNYHPMQRRFQVALPMKVYEYMACGIAVVCSKFPELAEQVKTDEIVLVEGDEPSDYADAILALLEAPDRLESIAQAGQAAIRNRLNWENSEMAKLIAMYQDLLA